jgi:type VI protein secretion system component VasK
MSNKKPDKNNTIDSVDQIRNILFGEQIAMIEKRFSELEKTLLNKIDQLAENLNQSNSDLSSQLAKSNKELQSESNSLSQNQAAELKSLGLAINNRITETESDLLNQMQSGLEKIDHKASHRNELAGLLKELADKLAD